MTVLGKMKWHAVSQAYALDEHEDGDGLEGMTASQWRRSGRKET